MSTNGKGSAYRPVDRAKWDANWSLIFRQPKNTKPGHMTTKRVRRKSRKTPKV